MTKVARDTPKHRPTTDKTITHSTIWEQEGECIYGNMQTVRAPLRMNGCVMLAWVRNNATSAKEQVMPIGLLTDTTPALHASLHPARAPLAKEPAIPLSPKPGSLEKQKPTCKHAEKWKLNIGSRVAGLPEALEEGRVRVVADAVSVVLLTTTLQHPPVDGCNHITTEAGAAVRIAVPIETTTIILATSATVTDTFKITTSCVHKTIREHQNHA